MNIYLIGYRCSGKSDVGKLLADMTGWQFLDADLIMVQDQGMSVSDIVSNHGWETFRELEKKCLKSISLREKCVVATGGGVVLDENNVKLLKKTGKVIWLKASYETIRMRMLNDVKTMELRPPLSTKGIDEEIRETLESRKPLYKKAMDFSIDTDGCTQKAIGNNIIDRLRGLGIEL